MMYDVTELRLTVALPMRYSLLGLKDQLAIFDHNGKECCIGRITHLYDKELDATKLEGFAEVRKYDRQLFICATVEVLDVDFNCTTLMDVPLCTELSSEATAKALTSKFKLYHNKFGNLAHVEIPMSAIAESIIEYYKKTYNEG